MQDVTLVELVEEGARRAGPGAPAVVTAEGALSYAELFEGARGIAAALHEAGVGRGSRVGLWMEKGPAALQVLLGVLLSGAAYVPLDPRSPWQRCRTIALDCQLEAVVVDALRLDALPAFLEGQAPRLLLVEGARPAQVAEAAQGLAWERLERARTRPPVDDLPRPAPEDVAYVLYTSGSTGVPKGVVHTHASGCAFVEWVRTTFGTGPQDVFSSHAPLHFDLSISDVFAAWASGARVRVLSTREVMLPAHLARSLDAWGITVWYSVPSALVGMLEAGLGERPPRALRTLFFAGEVFPTPQLRRLRRALPHVGLYNLFGPTETNVCTYYQVPDVLPEGSDAPIPIGRACEHMETFALDDTGREVHAAGEVGTLWARGGNLMLGYWNDPERTARTLQPDPRGRPGLAYNTGDLVRLRPDGAYDFLGRRDHMVKTRGYRVELGEVEAGLAAHPAVLEAVVVPVPDAALGNRLHASVVLRSGGRADADGLRAHLAERLPSYMVPDVIDVRSELPRTSTGKVDRGSLRAQWEGRAS